MKLAKSKLKQLIREELQTVLFEANFDSSTGEPTTEKGKAICAKNAACKEKWLKGEKKTAGDPALAALLKAKKTGASAADILLDKYKSPDDMPSHIRTAYDKIRASEEAKQGAERKLKAQEKSIGQEKATLEDVRKAHNAIMQNLMQRWRAAAGDQEKQKVVQNDLENLKKLVANKDYAEMIKIAQGKGIK